MQMRAVQVRRSQDWISVEGLNYVKRGEAFRMYEPDGREVTDTNGNKIFYAISDPYWSDNVGTWLIDVTPKPFH